MSRAERDTHSTLIFSFGYTWESDEWRGREGGRGREMKGKGRGVCFFFQVMHNTCRTNNTFDHTSEKYKEGEKNIGIEFFLCIFSKDEMSLAGISLPSLVNLPPCQMLPGGYRPLAVTFM